MIEPVEKIQDWLKSEQVTCTLHEYLRTHMTALLSNVTIVALDNNQ